MTTHLETLRDPIQQAMKQGVQQGEKVPGLAIALVRGGTSEVAAFGVRRYGDPDPVTPDTIFPAQSLTKPIVAYAVLKLIERGALALDTPLNEYLTEPYLSNEPDTAHITARHVLSHQTGFPNWRPRGEPLRQKWPVGTRFSYSGEGYVYLQHVAECITGQPWDAYMRDHVFEPLGMTNSNLIWQPNYKDRTAWGYGNYQNWEIRQSDTPNSAYSLYTTLDDLARFLQAMLFEGSDDLTDARLSRSSRDSMVAPQVCVGGDWLDLFWGLGWGLQRIQTEMVFWHWGAGAGYRNYMIGSLEHQIGVILLTNYEEGLYACQRVLSLVDHPLLSASQPAFDWLLPSEQWKEDGSKPR